MVSSSACRAKLPAVQRTTRLRTRSCTSIMTRIAQVWRLAQWPDGSLTTMPPAPQGRTTLTTMRTATTWLAWTPPAAPLLRRPLPRGRCIVGPAGRTGHWSCRRSMRRSRVELAPTLGGSPSLKLAFAQKRLPTWGCRPPNPCQSRTRTGLRAAHGMLPKQSCSWHSMPRTRATGQGTLGIPSALSQWPRSSRRSRLQEVCR
mmetsp:Transcript_141564/g.394561  ORF Transcript_141564/g.394561 Transcript_141564/m.394561 type:complete len:202 (+) Transcript_141564:1514-2119(+)